MTTTALTTDRFVAGSLPLYSDISVLSLERHGEAALVEERSYAFAARSPIIPLTADEFERAALDYPIIFVGPTRQPFAVMGLAADDNLFIEEDGAFHAGAYVPAYLRRHPFVLVSDPATGEWVLAVDQLSSRLVPIGEVGTAPLFENGAPTAATLEAVRFCEAFEAARQRTGYLVDLFDELDLLETRQAHQQSRSSEGSDEMPILLLDYVAIDRSRLDALEPSCLARLRDGNALAAIYAHILSAANWDRLALVGA